jgi:hypothetical protein
VKTTAARSLGDRAVDHVARDPLGRRRDGRIALGHPIVHHDDDDPLDVRLVGGHVGRHLSSPAVRRSAGIRDVHGGESHDGPRPTILEHDEIIGARSANGPAVPVEDRHVETDDIDAGVECRRRGLRGADLRVRFRRTSAPR